MYLLIVFLSLITSLVTLITGRWIGRIGACLFTVGGLFLSLFLSLIINFEISLSNSICVVYLFKWVDVGLFFIDIGFYFDTLTAVMLFVICLISSLVHLYSIEYMSHDPGFIRFMSYLSLFTFFMIMLVTADNYLQMFIGWEGVGLSSYLLISFWNTRFLANKAAIKAMLVNRIGDLALLIAMSILFYFFGTLKYAVIFALVPYFVDVNFYFILFNFKLLNVICFFLFIGAMGKSAQLGLHIWLPDAMEGPTPVSALIHAATMVTAGVFLVIRSSFIFEYASSTLVFVGLIGGFTCLFSSIIGAFQFDIKKIVAYSTCSQLGYMFFSCGVSNYSVSLFHLFNHAFFKALLFLSMGSIIHAMSDEQDFRRMGGLVNLLPFTYVMVMIGSLSLLAFPFLTGFYSKDMILEFTYSRFSINSYFLFLLGVSAAFFTAFYSTRLIYWVFLSPANFYKSNLPFIHEPGFYMTFSMFILSLFSIFAGYVFNECFIGVGSSFFGNSIFVFFDNFSVFDAEFSLFFVKYVPLFISLFGIFLFFLSMIYFEQIYNFFFRYQSLVLAYKFFSKSFFFDLVLVDFFFFKLLNFSYLFIYKYIEKGFFDTMLTIYIYIVFIYWHKFMIFLNTGSIYYYFFLIVFSFIMLFFFLQTLYFIDYYYMFIFFLIGFFCLSKKL